LKGIISGPRPGASCVFPFRHLGVVYNSCTSVGQSAPWCSTSTTSAGTHIDGEYGFCPSTCPTDSSSTSVTTTTTAAPTTSTTTTTTSSTSCIPSHRTATSVSVTLSVSQSVRQTLAEHALQFLVLPLVPPASSLSLMEESPTRVVLSGFTEESTRANIGALQSESTFHLPPKCFRLYHDLFFSRVDPTGTHVNGEGNYGFCSSECSGAPREFETVSRFRSASSSSSAVSFGGASASSRSRSPRRPF